MIHPWLGRSWSEVKTEFEGEGKPCVFQVTYPQGKVETAEKCRVVRVREFGDRIDIVLAHDMFSPRQT